MTPSPAEHLNVNVPTARWTRDKGDFSILGGSSLISHCEPHFHETYVIAYMRQGHALINFRDQARVWRQGEVFICSPYELVSCESTQGTLVYDVCYPSLGFVRQILGWSESDNFAIPRLSADALLVDDVSELATILGGFSPLPDQPLSCSTAEQRLIRFIRDRSFMVVDRTPQVDSKWVARVHDEIERSLYEHVSVTDLAQRLRCDRSHLMRVFKRATGLAPSSYVRQLRLARALDEICVGKPLADTAVAFGFADQAHLTREFKRVYGTSPGKLARDILH